MKSLLRVFLFGLLSTGTNSIRGESVEWIRQLGTTSFDRSQGVSADGLGNIYICGATPGNLGGPALGGYDAFVSKYNDVGSLLWTRQFGTTSDDTSWGVSADGLGNVFVSGYTWGSLGGPNAGSVDAYVCKYNDVGDLLWTRQISTADTENMTRVLTDGSGNIYVSGSTRGNLGGTNVGENDVFVGKIDGAGTLLWMRQLGTTGNELSQDVSVDGFGNVFISGWTEGNLGGPNSGGTDAFVSKYDSLGTLLWTRQFGTSSGDGSNGVAADELGNVYVSGWTDGSLGGINAGSDDAFVRKYDSSGGLLWTRQFGTSGVDYSDDVTTDRLGNVYVAGPVGGSLGGPFAGGGDDAFVRKYSGAGNILWTRQLGTMSNDFIEGVSADGLGNVYVSGLTGGSLGGPNLGEFDAFVAKIADPIIPEPSELALCTVGFLCLFAGGRRGWVMALGDR